MRDGGESESNKCKVPETNFVCLKKRGKVRGQHGEPCGESVETRETARTQVIRKPWKHFEERSDTRQMQKSATSSALPAGLL